MTKRSVVLALLTLVACALAGAGMAGAQSTSDVIWSIDNPRPGNVVTGLVKVDGYVLSTNGVSNIDLYVNGSYVSSADIDLPRVDVIDIYPAYRGTQGENPGFTTGFLANGYANGSTVHIELKVTLGDGSLLSPSPTRDVVVDNTLNQVPFGALELPRDDESVPSKFPVVGWALDGDGFVAQVDVLIDGKVRYGAVMGDYRPDVANAFGMIPGAEGAGYSIWVDSNALESGVHQIAVRITDNEGMARTLGPHRIQVFNNGVIEPPFGKIDVPLYDSEWQSALCGGAATCPTSPCQQFSVLDDVYVVSGWALDTGARADQGGVRYVELLFDGALIWNTYTDCGTLGGEFPLVPPPLDTAHVNCYGYFRPDVNMMFPGFTASANAGWLFVVDVYNQFIMQGYPEGLHYLTARAGDVEEAVSNIDVIPVKLTCPSQPDYQTLGYIDYPYDYEFVNGTVRYQGWVIDRDGLIGGSTSIHLWVDGHDMGSVVYGYESPDVTMMYPNYDEVQTSHARFVFDLDTLLLSDGEHDTYITVVDAKGNTLSFIGTRRIVVDNNVN